MEFLSDHWEKVMAAVMGIAWIVRLESLVKANEREIASLAADRENDLKVAAEARASTNAKLDKLDDKIERAFSEFRSDIKTLIRQGSER